LGEVGKEDFPISLGTFFSLAGEGLFFNDSRADVLEEFEDLHNVFVIEFGGKLGEGGDEWFEKRSVLVLVISEFFEDFVVSALDLGKCNSVDHVVDELNSFLEGGDGDRVLVIFFRPSSVFSFSLGCSLFDGFYGLIVILVGLVEVNASLLEDFLVVGD
jgi:hypothetical protein